MIINGDCLEEMGKMSANSIDFIVTDPPYGLNFMGKDWDAEVPSLEIWQQALRVCKPGAMLAAFGGTRTHHHLMIAIEEAGWEIRDMMMWLYGSGFPKSHNKFGLEGYGTALKPAWEPIILAMKPLDGTFKQNAEKWGVGGINIDESRIEGGKWKCSSRGSTNVCYGKFGKIEKESSPYGRWPANLILDEESSQLLGEPSRFFYCAKASPSERNERLEELEYKNIHPTVKPIALMKYIVKLLAPPGDPLCLDPFAGSGSTLVACKELGIRFMGIELQKDYCVIAEKRIESRTTPKREVQSWVADTSMTTAHGWAAKAKTRSFPPAHIRRKMRAQLRARAV